MRVLLVTGKGGVGKTTHALATAFGAAAHGHRVCVLSADPAHSLGDALARPVGAAAVAIAPGVVAREVNAQHELDRSWGEIQQLAARAAPGRRKRPRRRGAPRLPGARGAPGAPRRPRGGGDRRVRRLRGRLRADRRDAPDAPLPGRAEDLHGELLRPRAARRAAPAPARRAHPRRAPPAARGVLRRRRAALRRGRGRTADPARRDAHERAARGEPGARRRRRDAPRVRLPLPLRRRDRRRDREPPAAGSGRGRLVRRWAAKERDELAEIRASFDLPLLMAPLRAHEVRGEAALRALAEELYGERDPAGAPSERGRSASSAAAGARGSRSTCPARRRRRSTSRARGDELFVRVRDVVRRIALPASLAGRAVGRARLEGGRLRIELAP